MPHANSIYLNIGSQYTVIPPPHFQLDPAVYWYLSYLLGRPSLLLRLPYYLELESKKIVSQEC